MTDSDATSVKTGPSPADAASAKTSPDDVTSAKPAPADAADAASAKPGAGDVAGAGSVKSSTASPDEALTNVFKDKEAAQAFTEALKKNPEQSKAVLEALQKAMSGTIPSASASATVSTTPAAASSEKSSAAPEKSDKGAAKDEGELKDMMELLSKAIKKLLQNQNDEKKEEKQDGPAQGTPISTTVTPEKSTTPAAEAKDQDKIDLANKVLADKLAASLKPLLKDEKLAEQLAGIMAKNLSVKEIEALTKTLDDVAKEAEKLREAGKTTSVSTEATSKDKTILETTKELSDKAGIGLYKKTEDALKQLDEVESELKKNGGKLTKETKEKYMEALHTLRDVSNPEGRDGHVLEGQPDKVTTLQKDYDAKIKAVHDAPLDKPLSPDLQPAAQAKNLTKWMTEGRLSEQEINKAFDARNPAPSSSVVAESKKDEPKKDDFSKGSGGMGADWGDDTTTKTDDSAKKLEEANKRIAELEKKATEAGKDGEARKNLETAAYEKARAEAGVDAGKETPEQKDAITKRGGEIAADVIAKSGAMEKGDHERDANMMNYGAASLEAETKKLDEARKSFEKTTAEYVKARTGKDDPADSQKASAEEFQKAIKEAGGDVDKATKILAERQADISADTALLNEVRESARSVATLERNADPAKVGQAAVDSAANRLEASNMEGKEAVAQDIRHDTVEPNQKRAEALKGLEAKTREFAELSKSAGAEVDVNKLVDLKMGMQKGQSIDHINEETKTATKGVEAAKAHLNAAQVKEKSAKEYGEAAVSSADVARVETDQAKKDASTAKAFETAGEGFKAKESAEKEKETVNKDFGGFMTSEVKDQALAAAKLIGSKVMGIGNVVTANARTPDLNAGGGTTEKERSGGIA